MTSVLDVAAYILQRTDEPMTAMKLQKLTYYCQAWHLVWSGRRLFPEDFQAWANGPVCRELYDEHKRRYSLNPGDIPGDPGVLTTSQRFSIDSVVDAYEQMSAVHLSMLTHSEPPWLEARRGLAAGARSTAVIPTRSMKKYYKALADDPTATRVADVERPAWA